MIFGDGLERAFQAVENASAKAFKWEETCCILRQAKKLVFLGHSGGAKHNKSSEGDERRKNKEEQIMLSFVSN